MATARPSRSMSTAPRPATRRTSLRWPTGRSRRACRSTPTRRAIRLRQRRDARPGHRRAGGAASDGQRQLGDADRSLRCRHGGVRGGGARSRGHRDRDLHGWPRQDLPGQCQRHPDQLHGEPHFAGRRADHVEPVGQHRHGGQYVYGNGVTLDQDIGEQAALHLTVNGNSATPIGASGAGMVAFAVAGLDPEDTGTVTFTDGHGKTFQVNVNGTQTSYTANLTSLADGPITSSLSVNTDTAGNTFTATA